MVLVCSTSFYQPTQRSSRLVGDYIVPTATSPSSASSSPAMTYYTGRVSGDGSDFFNRYYSHGGSALSDYVASSSSTSSSSSSSQKQQQQQQNALNATSSTSFFNSLCANSPSCYFPVTTAISAQSTLKGI